MTAIGLLAAAFSAPPELPWKLDAVATGATLAPQSDGSLRASVPASGGRVLLVELLDPKPPQHRYRLRSKISYEGVTDPGHLEMLSRTVRSEYFTRTLDASGPLGKIVGSSPPRDVELPFVADPNEMPDRIQLWLVLPKGGNVTLQPFVLEAWRMDSRTWIYTGGLSAVVGVSIGLLGGAFGLLCAIPEARSLARRFAYFAIAAGLFAATVGGGLAIVGQPFGLWFPCAAGGGLLTVLFAIGARIVPSAPSMGVDS